MSEIFTVNALVRKLGTKVNKYGTEKLEGWFFFDKEATDTITGFLEPNSKANKKRIFHLKPVNREKHKNIPEKYTHEMNMDTYLSYMDNCILDLYGNEIEHGDINMGDVVMVSGTEKLTKQEDTKRLYLGAYLSSLALIKPNAVEIKIESTNKLDMLKKLEAMREEQTEDTISL